MGGFNYARLQKRADNMITRFGGKKNNGKLRRNGVDRPCTCVVIEYTPSAVGLVQPGSRRALVSKFDPTTGAPLAQPPDHEQDLLVFAGDVLRIVMPDSGPRPNGDPVYHDLEVQYDSRDI
jgi:hypothetical protein